MENNIFLTGVAGFIGSVVAELLLKSDFSVIGIDNFQDSDPSSVNGKVIFYEGNYGDKSLLKKIFSKHKIDTVFHFAAETTIEYSMTNPSIYFTNNVVNGIALLDAMLKHNVKKIIFSSTAAVYGEPKSLPIAESHEKKPINSYGASKLMFENILEWYYVAYGIKYNLFRYFNAVGAGDNVGENRKNENHLLPLICKSILDDKFQLNVYGNDYNTKDGTCIRDYVHVKDIAEAHLLAMKNIFRHPNGKYNLGSASGYSIFEIINAVEKITGKKVNWTFKGRRAGDPDKLVASNNLAIKELGWQMNNSSIETIVTDTYKWFSSSLRKRNI